MPRDNVWFLLAIITPVSLLQWWGTRKLHRARLAVVKTRHLKAQQTTDRMLQQSRQQNAQLQQELAAARLALKLPQPKEPPARDASPYVRETLMKVLDGSPAARRTLLVDGFPETMPSLMFQSSAMGPL